MSNESLRELCIRLANAKRNSPTTLLGLHIFYIDENYSLFISEDGALQVSESGSDHSDIKYLSLERGDILELFSKLEFIVNECLRTHFLGLGFQKGFEQLIENVDLGHRIKTLFKEGIITNSLSKKIPNAVYVRNQIAHKWKFKDIMYLEKDLEDDEQFSTFKKDMEYIFSELIKAHQSLLNKNNMAYYISCLIRDINKNS